MIKKSIAGLALAYAAFAWYLAAVDVRKASPRDLERLSQKVVAATGESIDTVKPLMQVLFGHAFKQFFNKAERLATRPGDARRLVALARERAGEAARPGEQGDAGSVLGPEPKFSLEAARAFGQAKGLSDEQARQLHEEYTALQQGPDTSYVSDAPTQPPEHGPGADPVWDRAADILRDPARLREHGWPVKSDRFSNLIHRYLKRQITGFNLALSAGDARNQDWAPIGAAVYGLLGARCSVRPGLGRRCISSCKTAPKRKKGTRWNRPCRRSCS